MNQKLIEFNKSQRRNDIPDLRAGDVIRVSRKIKEGGKERLQKFEGMIIALKGGQSASQTITVRKVSAGIGVELIFSLNSSQIEKIELIKRTRTRRAKLYYVRTKSSKILGKKLKEVSKERGKIAKASAETVPVEEAIVETEAPTQEQE